VQIADAPGRHQSGTGGLPIEQWIAKIAATGYDGRIALEYVPEGPSADSFGWLEGKR
jgi:hydroxypyruvate isomerase